MRCIPTSWLLTTSISSSSVAKEVWLRWVAEQQGLLYGNTLSFCLHCSFSAFYKQKWLVSHDVTFWQKLELSFLSKNYTYIRTWYSFKLSECCMRRWNKYIVKWYHTLWKELSALQPVFYDVMERHKNSNHLKFHFYIFSLLSGSFRGNPFYSLICYHQIYLVLQTPLGSYWFWCNKKCGRVSERHHECSGLLSILGMSPILCLKLLLVEYIRRKSFVFCSWWPPHGPHWYIIRTCRREKTWFFMM